MQMYGVYSKVDATGKKEEQILSLKIQYLTIKSRNALKDLSNVVARLLEETSALH